MTLLEKTSTPIGSYAPDFELPGIDNSVHHLSRYLDKFQGVGVVFISNTCPYVNLYLDRLKRIQAEFRPQGITVIGINGNDVRQAPEESFDQMKIFATHHQLNFPYLWDPTQDVTRVFGATKTPTAFLIDKLGVLRYSGAIDDNPQVPQALQRQYLRNAFRALLNGEPIIPEATEPVGGLIQWFI